jgi:heme-degrading monooxygenase HmoA
MILAIVNHYCKPAMVEKAARRMDENGAAMAAAPGFRFRYRMISTENPNKMSSVTAWESREAYDNYLEARRQGPRGADFAGESPYERIDTEFHTVEQAEVKQL